MGALVFGLMNADGAQASSNFFAKSDSSSVSICGASSPVAMNLTFEPLQAANMSSVWTLFYTQPSRYNWMLQYYLRLEGLALSWVGTGRLIFSLNYSDADFEAVLERFVRAARQMQQDGWWWQDDQLTNRSIRRRILKETFKR